MAARSSEQTFPRNDITKRALADTGRAEQKNGVNRECVGCFHVELV
jgi:hypothetical protein